MSRAENNTGKGPAGASEPARQWVRSVSSLVSPPDICVRLLELTEDLDASAADIGGVITQDPSLTARLLRMVNSSFYSFPSRIDTVSRAVAVVGIRELYRLVLAVSAVQMFSRIPAGLVNMDTFWRHSIYTGLIARALARRVRVLHPERLFVAGLLHDIGSLVLYHKAPEQAREMLVQADGDEERLHGLEREILGFTHADIGGHLLELWQLPAALRTAVTFHHDPGALEEVTLEAALVHLGDVFANHSEIGAFCEEPAAGSSGAEAAWRATGLDATDFDMDEVIGEAGLQFTETAALLCAKV
ncbi:MAG TPA: HDOD domain-containing protein [Gammaproteobacteria bacterium]|nr:HDOD domain-containing protein [Gammaproteobacteria bacterium]